MSLFSSIELRLATEEDKHLTAYDNTKLVALDTCVTWGILTYQMHKIWPGSVKAQALEAGTALHQAFASIRLWQLYHYDLKDVEYNLRDQILSKQLKRLFGVSRVDYLKDFIAGPNTREALMNFSLQVLGTSGYEEDPTDKKRTMSALEDVVLNYNSRWDMTKYPIWVRDKTDPNTDVGIEIGFDIVITFVKDRFKNTPITESYRFTGKLDGLHHDPSAANELFVVDNKSTSRITDTWGDAYDMSTQMIGYDIAGSIFTEQIIDTARVIASSLPVPKTSAHGGVDTIRKQYEDHMKYMWFEWFYNLTQVAEQYKDNPIAAPVSPHSCVRYFRTCSMLPFCTASKAEQVEALEQMETYEWNVLAEED